MYQFQEAKAVWISAPVNTYNQFAAFHTCLEAQSAGSVKVAIAARSYYRMYLDGEMVASGPARTAKGYCRVDEISLELKGKCHLAVEAAAYSKPEKYCNDCTMEPGLLVVEVTDEKGKVLSATGWDSWTCRELTYRRSMAETMSHCRGIVEYYDLTPDSFNWRTEELPGKPEILKEAVSYLQRRAPYASQLQISVPVLQRICDISSGETKGTDSDRILAKLANPKWYQLIPEENYFLESLAAEKESVFTGICQVRRNGKGQPYVRITPGSRPSAVLWKIPQSEVGFLDFSVTVDDSCIIDVIHSDHLDSSGMLKGNAYAARYCLQKGSYHLTTFEPKLVQYIKFVIRSKGSAKLSAPAILDDTYPDNGNTCFQCDDGDLNRIYEAARRTLRLNTLDIFMDCPERERGGWLCDSYFTARGAWQLFGDLSVEKDFLENFMLTDAGEYWNGFFPEVYPGVRGTSGDVGIRNWSFWLILQLHDYVRRSGNWQFARKHQQRIEKFVSGVLSLRGESGLLENTGTLFVDWSLSNSSFALEPISVPINCLAVCMLEKAAELYSREDWKTTAGEMRRIITELDNGGPFSGRGDSAYMDNVNGEIKLKRGTCQTESGTALELWSGFHSDDTAFRNKFICEMGSSPQYRADPNIGKSNLFIGLMIRFDLLARLGKTDVLVKELKDLYLEELRIGAGTLFEGIHDRSGCHGFNAYAGALLTNEVLGLGMPLQSTKTVRISPHPGGLKWAYGSAVCSDGIIFVRWAADHEDHILDVELFLPEGWNAVYDFPFELSSWTIRINGAEWKEAKE